MRVRANSRAEVGGRQTGRRAGGQFIPYFGAECFHQGNASGDHRETKVLSGDFRLVMGPVRGERVRARRRTRTYPNLSPRVSCFLFCTSTHQCA